MDDEFEDEELEELEQAEQEQEWQEIAMQEMSEAEKQAEERKLSNQLKAIHTKVVSKRLFVLSPQDTKIIKTAKKNKKFVPKVTQIYMALASNAQKTTSMAMSASPVLFYVAIGALLLFLLIAVVAFFASLISWMPGTDGSTGTADSMFGITGTDFYGARMVYKDEELAQKKIVEDYVELVENGIQKLENTTNVTVGETSYNLTLDVTINLPDENFDYSTYSDSQFKQNYPVAYNLALIVAKEMYKTDNENATFEGTELIKCVEGIKYFGYSNVNSIATLLLPEILSSTTLTAKNAGETVTDETILDNIEAQVVTDVNTALTAQYNKEKYATRTEKLFVKDYILEGEETISGVTQENYVALIFMPKKNVNMQKLSFMVGGTDLTNFSITALYNGSTIDFATDGSNLGDETNSAYIYSSGTINVEVQPFTEVGDNVQALETEHSLFDIIQSADLNYATYLQKDNTTQLFTLKLNGLMVLFSNPTPIMVVEYETFWE